MTQKNDARLLIKINLLGAVLVFVYLTIFVVADFILASARWFYDVVSTRIGFYAIHKANIEKKNGYTI